MNLFHTLSMMVDSARAKDVLLPSGGGAGSASDGIATGLTTTGNAEPRGDSRANAVIAMLCWSE